MLFCVSQFTHSANQRPTRLLREQRDAVWKLSPRKHHIRTAAPSLPPPPPGRSTSGPTPVEKMPSPASRALEHLVRCHSASLHTEVDSSARHAANYLKHWHASGTSVGERSDKTLSAADASRHRRRSASSCRVFIGGTTVAGTRLPDIRVFCRSLRRWRTVYVSERID